MRGPNFRWRGAVIETLEDRRLLSSTPFRPPAVPLLTSDPFLSVWSEADNLTDDVTREWTGTAQPLVSLIRIDGTTYRLMGTDPSSAAAFPQTGLRVTPTRSIYDFDNGHVHVTLTFETAALPNNLDVLTRPLSYINWDVRSVDGLSHVISIYDSTGSELAVDSTDQVVKWGRAPAGALTALQVGTVSQTLLSPGGDQVGIDYGYLYAAASSAQSKQGVSGDAEQIAAFESTGTLVDKDDTGTRAPNNDEPVLAFAFPLGSVTGAVVSRHLIVAYDEEYEVNYFGENLKPYWKRNGETMLQLLQTADNQYASLTTQCVAFDNQLNADLTTEGGSQYAQLTALAYRQALTATGIAADDNKQPLLFTKEETSNGDIATADVIFPTDPIFFLLNPTLAKASLVPLLAFAGSPAWTMPYAPHDLGTYPNAEGEPGNGEEQPVEESGNMLIMVDTIAHEENSAEFANNYWTELTTWAQYLQPYAYDPGSQLTTDDFLGTIQSSVNLAIKAIEGLGAYSQLCTLRGDSADATTYMNLARADEQHLLSVASDGNHLRLGYNLPNSWSQDYNLVWDKILGLNIFPTSLAAEEIAYYKTVVTPYGLPVESTTNTAKADWSVWTASLATNLSDFETLVTPLYNFMDTTGNRQPLQDEYDVTNIDSGGFHARSVVGGLFIRMLEDPAMWKKYSSQDYTLLTGWAPLPTVIPVLPDALTTPQVWNYTTDTPASNWTSLSFNDSSWSSGPGGFGTADTPGAIVNTTWNTDDIYLRKSFTMPAGSFGNLSIQAYHDEDMQVYINGVLATSQTGYITSYQIFSIAPAALSLLKPGATVEIAVHCLQTYGGQDIDVGLVSLATIKPVLPDALTTPQAWKYTTDTPASNWTSQTFDDSAWSSGTGGFGTTGTAGAIVNTVWNTGDIYLRKSFTLPAGPFSNLQIQAFHDEDMQVYVNGVAAVSVAGYNTSYQLFTVAPAALALLKPGATVEIAVHCHQTGGGQDIDVGLVDVVPVGTPTLPIARSAIPVAASNVPSGAGISPVTQEATQSTESSEYSLDSETIASTAHSAAILDNGQNSPTMFATIAFTNLKARPTDKRAAVGSASPFDVADAVPIPLQG